MFRIVLCEYLASPYANVSHASVRRSCTARYEGLALLGAKVLHCSVRMSRMPRCETLEIPKPEFYVIYNGTKERPAVEELRLSDAFMDCGAVAP